MEITEKELQDILMEKGYFCGSENKFEDVIHFVEKEFKIGQERIDILGVDEHRCFYVIELKKGIIDSNALVQALSYTAQLKFMLRNEEATIKTILVGDAIENRTEKAILGFDDVCFIKYVPNIELESHNKEFIKDFYDVELKNTSKKLMDILLEHEELEEVI